MREIRIKGSKKEDEKVLVRCDKCEGAGDVCFTCGKNRYDCTCGPGSFSPVVCAACNGERYIEQ